MVHQLFFQILELILFQYKRNLGQINEWTCSKGRQYKCWRSIVNHKNAEITMGPYVGLNLPDETFFENKLRWCRP